MSLRSSICDGSLPALPSAMLQVLELLAAERQQQAASVEQHPAASCEQLLVLHQLTWQMEAMQALLQLQAAHGANASSK